MNLFFEKAVINLVLYSSQTDSVRLYLIGCKRVKSTIFSFIAHPSLFVYLIITQDPALHNFFTPYPFSINPHRYETIL